MILVKMILRWFWDDFGENDFEMILVKIDHVITTPHCIDIVYIH